MILSETLLRNISQTNLQPIIIWQIEGVPTLFGSDTIKKPFLYGDPDAEYGGDDLFYGGLIPYPNQSTLISLEGTTTSIKQTLEPDKARSSGISQMSIALIDKNLEATQLASGITYGEILYKKCKVWIGFGEESGFNDDFILVFRGIIESVSSGQGKVTFNLNSPDQKKRQLLLPKSDHQLDGAINNSVTNILLDNVDNLFIVPDHPAYSTKDPSIKTYIVIEDEIIEFTGISTNTLTGCIRGSLGTTAVSHGDETSVDSFYKLEGNSMDLALKIMLSDADQTPYIIDLEATSVNIASTDMIENIMFFSGLDFSRDYNIKAGDYVMTTGFSESSNNLSSWTLITDVVLRGDGSYILLDADLDYETPTDGTVTFLSQYNTLGFGLFMDTDEVDINKHQEFKLNFLSLADLRFFIRDEIEEGKAFIEEELYRPLACYPLPSDKEGLSRVSVGIHKPPLPNQGIITISSENIIKPETLSIQRSSNKNYYNAVLVRYEDLPLDEKFYRKVFQVSGTQVINTGNKALVIDSKGLKEIFNANLIATTTSGRLLERYYSAAEYMSNVQVRFKDGIQITVGDIIILDGEDLNLINRTDESRDRPPRLMEVVNRSVDIKSGKITLDLVDTAFNVNARYGLFSASSLINSIISQNKFVIGPMLSNSKYGTAEYRKWINLKLPAVKIRTRDFSNVFETVISSVSFNTIELRDDVSFTLTGGEIMELATYSNVDTTDQVKLIYAFLSDNDNDFADGNQPYVFI